MSPLIRTTLITSSLFTHSALGEIAQDFQQYDLMIRCDQLVIDLAKQRELKDYLIKIAKHFQDGTPMQKRTAYKALILAEQLKANPKAVSALAQQIQQKHPTAKALKPLPPEPQNIKDILKFLESVKLRSDNTTLSTLAREVINEATEGSPSTSSSKLWNKAIPPVNQFKEAPPKPKKLETLEKEKEEYIVPIDTNESESEPRPPAEREPVPELIKWTHQTIKIPLIAGFFSDHEEDHATIRIVPRSTNPNIKSTRFTVAREADRRLRRLRFLDDQNLGLSPRAIQQSNSFSLTWKEQYQISFPSHAATVEPANVTLYTPESFNYTIHSDCLIPTTLSYLNSSIQGSEIDTEYIVIGFTDNNKLISKSDDIWNIINDLESSKTTKLIFISKENEEEFIKSRKFGHLQIFLNHNIVSINSLDDIQEYLIKMQSEALVEAEMMMQEVKNVLRGKSTNDMLRNRFVQEKIAQIIKLNPQNISAKSLVIQSKLSDQPIPNEVMAEYWTQILKPLENWLDYTLLQDPELVTYNTALEANSTPNQLVDSLEAAINIAPINVKSRHRTLYKEIEKLISGLKIYSKSYNNDKNFESSLRKSKLEGKRPLKKLYNDIVIKLSYLNNI